MTTRTTAAALVAACFAAGCQQPVLRPVSVPQATPLDAAVAVDVASEATAVDEPPADVPTADVAPADVPLAPMVPVVSYVSPGGEGETGARVIGLPALSADGVTLLTTVSLPSSDAGDRLVVQLRSARTGAVQRTLVIVGPTEAQALLRGPFTPAIDARLRAQAATANAVFGRLRARTIPGVEAEDVALVDGGPSEVATGAGWFVAIIDERLVVRRGDARGPVALRVRVPRMEAAEARCLVIPRPTMRGFFVVAPDRLLVQVDYLGNYSCEGGPGNWMLVAPR